jgi:hypothetical protein
MELLEYLFQNGMTTTRQEYVPIIAAKKGHVDMLKYALDHEYHLNHKQPQAILQYALVAAIYHQQFETSKVLL